LESSLDEPHATHVSSQGQVVSLETLRRDTVERGGGKGANLGELLTAELDVPPDFCVTTAAYRRGVSARRRGARSFRSDRKSAKGCPDDPDSAETASASITMLFEDLPLPDDLAEEILVAYRALGAPPVAVRSSATAEDLPGASFAGQQATLLNVRGENELLSAVRHCWGSLWSDLDVEAPPSRTALTMLLRRSSE
jgi:phosphoenolpyruvate synthase/pyruvate phosphate dikinase